VKIREEVYLSYQNDDCPTKCDGIKVTSDDDMCRCEAVKGGEKVLPKKRV